MTDEERATLAMDFDVGFAIKEKVLKWIDRYPVRYYDCTDIEIDSKRKTSGGYLTLYYTGTQSYINTFSYWLE